MALKHDHGVLHTETMRGSLRCTKTRLIQHTSIRRCWIHPPTQTYRVKYVHEREKRGRTQRTKRSSFAWGFLAAQSREWCQRVPSPTVSRGSTAKHKAATETGTRDALDRPLAGWCCRDAEAKQDLHHLCARRACVARRTRRLTTRHSAT